MVPLIQNPSLLTSHFSLTSHSALLPMSPSEIITSLRSGSPVFGTLITCPSPAWPPLIAKIGFDYVFIDTEHIPIQREQLAWMCRSYSALGLPAIVRSTSPCPYEATAILDGGASGIIAPYIESAEQVRTLVGAVKTRPLKGLKLASYLNGDSSLEPSLATYTAERAANNILIVNIESVPAMEALDEILAVDGLDAVLIGPHDLTCSLGIPEQYGHPEFIAAVDTILTKARAAGKGAGIHTIFPQDRIKLETRWISEKGANLILHSADVIAAIETLTRELSEVKSATGRSSLASTENINI